MVRSRYPYLAKQRHRWFVRMVVPPDVRAIIGKAVFKVPTGHTDEHKAVSAAAAIIAELQQRIATARQAGKRLEQITAEQLAEKYRAERDTDPDKAELTKITDVIEFVLKTQGHNLADYARQVREVEPFGARLERNTTQCLLRTILTNTQGRRSELSHGSGTISIRLCGVLSKR